jgi:hypothetical protein
MNIKKIFAVLILFILLATSFARADSYTNSIASHIITQKIQNNDINYSAVGNAEFKRTIHQLNLGLLTILFNNKSKLLDGVSTQMRSKVDRSYKCSLQGDYRNKHCS